MILNNESKIELTNSSKKRMNVLILVSSISGGGAERRAVSVANYLNEKGHNVNIVILYSSNGGYIVNKDIKIDILPNRKKNISNSYIKKLYCIISDYISLKKIIDNNNIEKIILFHILPAILILLLTKRLKIIASERTYPPSVPFWYAFLKKIIFSYSKVIVFQTSEQMSFFNASIRRKSVVIYNPLVENLPAPYIGIRKKEMITFCRLEKVKNLPMLINGFIEFHKKFPVYKLIIYGEGTLKKYLLKYINEARMNEIIRIKKFTNNIHELIIDSACYISTSNYEGLSNSMLEAMAIGMPVVCTDCKGGGAREFIVNYNNGILIAIDDIKALAEALEYIVLNPIEAQKMGERAIEIKKILASEKIYEEWIRVLEC